jgi:hypothetical protein
MNSLHSAVPSGNPSARLIVAHGGDGDFPTQGPNDLNEYFTAPHLAAPRDRVTQPLPWEFSPDDFDLPEEMLTVRHRSKPEEGEVSVGAPPPLESDQPCGAPSAPAIQLFRDEDLVLLELSAESKDSESKERMRRILRRLRQLGGQRPLAVLPVDWNAILDQLESEFPNFHAFVEFLRGQFALGALGDGRIALPPVMFDGPPGVGKTEMVLRLADLFGSTSLVLDMASAQSGAALSGSEVFWANTREGRLFSTLAYGPTANPVVFLDELDKTGQDTGYRPDAALHQLLEPRTAARFQDLSVPEITLDASHVLWFAATNEVSRVEPPIRSRFEIFSIPAPDATQAALIAQSIYRAMILGKPWGHAMAPELPSSVAQHLAGFSPRAIRVKLAAACGRAAREGRRDITTADVARSKAVGTPSRRTIGFVA